MTEKFSKTYKPISKEEAAKIIENVDVFLLTATDIETASLHSALTPIEGFIYKAGIDSYVYYIAQFGNYLILHTQCKAGSASSGGSNTVTSHAISLCKPKAIIMVGIAFGINKKKQKIGDVLISESLWPYDIQKVSENEFIHRGGNPKASIHLVSRFKDGNWTFKYFIGNSLKEFKSKIIPGTMFSGEKLIDNLDFRERLQKQVPEAIGGEMEGFGLASAAESSKTDWIIVKGICDFADGKKKTNKGAFQLAGAEAAVAFCKNILSEEHVLSELGIRPISNSKMMTGDPNLVLFRNYTYEAEPYYHQREIDFWFIGFLKNYSIWIHGESGCGKSTVIVRNLQKSGCEIIQICLASGTDYDITSILKLILVNLKIYFKLPNSNFVYTKADELIDEISQLIISKFDFNKHVIHLDEIPEYKEMDTFNAFFKSIYAINVNILNAAKPAGFVFVLSSITSPIPFIHATQKKVLESFKFNEMKNWNEQDFTELMKIIVQALNLNFSSLDIEKIITVSKRSPRLLKRIIRDYLSTKESGYITLDRILSEIEAEI